MSAAKLLTYGNPKIEKGNGFGYSTAILHLAPSDVAGTGFNVCPHASPQCIALCLNTAGRGGIFRKGESTNAIQTARIRKTRAFFSDRKAFIASLVREIGAHVKRAERNGLKPAVRLNGTSDLAWESFAGEIFATFPNVVFYDYSKSARRMRAYLAGEFPSNYSLTFSRSETNEAETADILARGGNVAFVFSTKRGESLPPSVVRFPSGVNIGIPFAVIDGDVSDLRFTDPRGVVVGLRAKGRARKSEFRGGFVVNV